MWDGCAALQSNSIVVPDAVKPHYNRVGYLITTATDLQDIVMPLRAATTKLNENETKTRRSRGICIL